MPSARPELSIKNARITRKDLRGEKYGPTNRTFLLVLDQTLAKTMGYTDDNPEPIFGERAVDHLVMALQEENWPCRYFGEGDEESFNEKIRNGEFPDAWVSCKVRYNDDPNRASLNPKVWVKIGNSHGTLLDETTIGTVDAMDIDHVNVALSLNFWERGVPGSRAYRSGYTAYVQKMFVFGVEDDTDDLADDFFDADEPDELPWN